jgi:phosphoglycolate phosphatase-like HAD superfamily hydrolase
MSEQQIEVGVQINTVLWDLDGTLLDSFGIYRDCLNEVLRRRSRPEVPEEVLRQNYYGFIEDSILGALQDAGQTVPAPELEDIIKDFYVLDNAFIKDVDHHLYSDAVDLSKRLHVAGKRQIVVTSRPHGTNRQNGSPRNLVQNSSLN